MTFSSSKFTEYYLAEYGWFDVCFEIANLDHKQTTRSKCLVKVPINISHSCPPPAQPILPVSVFVPVGSI